MALLIKLRNPRPLGVVRDKRLCLKKSPLERWSNGVLEYWKRFALPLIWLGKLNSLFVNRHKDCLAIENAQNFQDCKIFRCFSCHCFPVLQHSITPLTHSVCRLISPLWGQINATSSGRGFFTNRFRTLGPPGDKKPIRRRSLCVV